MEARGQEDGGRQHKGGGQHKNRVWELLARARHACAFEQRRHQEQKLGGRACGHEVVPPERERPHKTTWHPAEGAAMHLIVDVACRCGRACWYLISLLRRKGGGEARVDRGGGGRQSASALVSRRARALAL